MKVLGISAYYHDSGAAIVENGRVLFAAQEERFSRIKHDANFPENAIRYCLDESGFSIEELDEIAFYDKPFLKFERLLETYYAFAPNGFRSFAKAMPIWLKEKLFTKPILKNKLQALSESKTKPLSINFPEHHLSHAASAFYTSPFQRAAFLTIDGVGEWATTSYGIACGKEGIKVLGELHFPDSLGLFYSSFTYFLGFRVNSGEYKMMGLAPYSNLASPKTQQFIKIIKEQLVDIKNDGSIVLNRSYFEFPVGLRMVNPRKWESLFGIKKRLPEENLAQEHADLAFAAQKVLEDILVKIITHVKKETNEKYLCLAGGVALNCVANSVLFKQKIFDDLYIQPAAGDAGGAIGAALITSFLKQKLEFTGLKKPFNIYLGPKYSGNEIERVLRKYKSKYEYATEEDLLHKTTEFLQQQKVVGWFQGRTEFGPRALGNRSILADATGVEMQQRLNRKIKFREGFRPFAPVVCEEDYDTYFAAGKRSKYMLFTSTVKESLRIPLPEHFDNLSLPEKREYAKSTLPAITHIDFSARVQVVHEDFNPRLWKLLQLYKEKTGVAILINTSFNLKDEPIVNSPENAYLCFLKSGMDVLILENYIITK